MKTINSNRFTPGKLTRLLLDKTFTTDPFTIENYSELIIDLESDEILEKPYKPLVMVEK